MSKQEPEWLEFEKLCTEIRQRISPKNYKVKHSVMKVGSDSGYQRQLDIVISPSDNEDLFTFLDAKCYSRKVDVKDVESILGLSRDVRALKCGIVTTVGYTKAAYNVAQANNMDLVLLVDTDEHKWKKFISIPFCISLHIYTFSSMGIKGTIPLTNIQGGDPFTAPIHILGEEKQISLGGYVVNEFELEEEFGFPHPECTDKNFEIEVPINTSLMGNGYLIVNGTFTKKINHHQKFVVFDEYHGFVDSQKASGFGEGKLKFDLEEVEKWQTIESPPKKINFCHPHFLSHNLPYTVDDINA